MKATRCCGLVRSALFGAILSAVVTLVGLPAVARSASPWEAGPFAADPKALVRAATEEAAKVTDAVLVLLDERRIEVDAEGRLTESKRLIYRINSESALEWWSGVEESWAPWRQDRPQVRARVITPDGVVHELDQKLLVEAPASERDPLLYGDRRVLRAPLPAVTVGAVVEEMETVRDTQPQPAGGVAWRAAIGRYGTLLLQRVAISVPSAMPLHVELLGLEGVQPETRTGGDRTQYIYVFPNPEKWSDFESGLPPEVMPTPVLGFSTVTSWQTVATAYAAIVERQLAGADLAATAKKWAGGARGREQIIRAVGEALMKEIRYTGVHFGNASIVPWSPKEALKRRFGDCKDQATLLVGLLRALGIEAHVALLSTGPGTDLSPRLPGLEVFDHAIVYIPGSPTVWVDPTARYMRPGELPEPDLGRQALIAAPGTTGLTLTPEGSARDNRTVTVREVFLAKTGESRIVETTEAWGIPEGELRATFANMKPDAREERLRDYVRSEFLAKELGTVAVGEPADLAKPFRYSIEARTCSRAMTLDASAVVTIPLGSLLQEVPGELWKQDEEEGEEPQTRRNDFVFPSPFTAEMRYRIVPPPGFSPRPLPAAEERMLGTMLLTQESSADEAGIVVVQMRLESGPKRLTPQEVEGVRTDLARLAEENALQIWFDQVGEAHLAAGRVREALEQFGALARTFPREAIHHNQLARALLAAGMGEEARAEALRATQVEPASAAAHSVSGWILQHDLIGRRFKPGFDREGALAAYRKAAELDPKDAGVRADLAILLEHGTDGQRYQNVPDLTAAIAEYRYLRNELKDKRFDSNLLYALMWTQRFGELAELAGEMKPDAQTRAWLVLARTAQEGVEAGLKDAQRRIPATSERRQALASTAERLFQLRLYEDAAVLLDEVAQGATDAAQLRARAEMLRKVRRHDETDLGPEDALGVFKRMLLAVFTSSGDGRKLLSFYPPEIVAALKEDEAFMAEHLESMRQVAAMPASSGVPKLILLDISLSLLEAVVDGKDQPVQRLRAQYASDDRPTRTVLYLTRRPEGLKVLASDDDIGMLGGEILRLVEAGDLESARQLCEWAREAVTPRTGDDPLVGPIFPRVWSKGDEASPDRLRLAGAVLAAGSPLAKKNQPVLEAQCALVTEPGHRLACDLALGAGYVALKQSERQLAIVQRLLETYPDSDQALALAGHAALTAGKWDLAHALARARLEKTPGDPTGRRLMADSLAARGDYSKAIGELQSLVDDGKEAIFDYNQIAWYELMSGKIDDTAMMHAQRAVERTRGAVYASIHTQAAMFAERGQTTEAYQTILKGLTLKDDEQPESADWYVFGRLAEWYGLPDAAARYYRRVELQEFEPPAVSTHLLAQRRLDELKKASPGKKPAR